MVELSKQQYPLITVCIAAFNVELYIEECLDSVLNQSYLNLEILITDDCSTDGTLNLIKTYTDPRIRLISNDFNLGSNSSIANMYSKAKGELLCSVDADDRLDIECIWKCFEALQVQPTVGMVFTHSAYFGARQGKTYFNIEPYRIELLTKYLVCFHFRLFRAEFWKHIERFDSEVTWDYELVCKLAQLTKIVELPQVLYYWRQHNAQQHHKFEAIEHCLKIKQEFAKYLAKIV